MKFYGYFRSSSAYRCRIAFNLKNLAPEFVPVHLRRDGGEQKKASYLKINPEGLIPALEIDGDILVQSLAIIEWLDEVYPAPALLPRDPVLKAKVRGFAQIIACDVHPLQNLRVLEYIKGPLGRDQDAADAWCHHWISAGLGACEELLQREKVRGDFSFGETPGLADICLIPQMYSAKRFGVDTAPFKRLNAVWEACEVLDVFSKARPEAQPDAEH